MRSFYEVQAANKRKTVLLFLVFIGLITLLGYVFDKAFGGGMVFLPLAFIFAVLYSLFSYFNGHRLVLASLRARKADPNVYEEKVLIDVVHEMSIAAGIPRPRVYVIPDPAPNALATGRNPEDSYVAATEGLLKMLNREELQGVIAHEISHIRNYDILTMTLVASLVGVIAILARWIWHSFYWGGRRRREERGGNGIILLIALVLMIIAPILARLLALAVSRAREYLADASAAELTRNPLGLASALRKIAGWKKPMRVANEGTAHLFISDPFRRSLTEKESLLANLFSTHPPIHRRIKLLEEMAGGGR